MAEQQENDALTLALKILKAAPIQDSFKTVTESGLATTYDYLPQRNAALHALETFDALDEYTRKVKAYYKEDTGNVIYDMLMAEYLLRQNPAAATPFLEKAHALDPDNPVVAGSLATRYAAEGADASLLTLLDSILQENLPIPPELRIDVVGVYAPANQLSRLTTLFANNLKNEDTPSPSGGGDQRLAYSLESALIREGRKSDLVVFYQACAAAKLNDFNPGVHLAELGLEVGDRDTVEEQCEAQFFPPKTDRRLGPGPRLGVQDGDDLPSSPIFDLVRLSKQSGHIDQMKKRAEADFDLEKHSLGGAEDRLMLVLVFSHDPETLVRLPDYLKDIESEPSNRFGGTPYGLVYAIFGELLRWPEAKDMLKPTLEAALQVEHESQPGRYMETARKVSALALKMGDKVMAQTVLRDALVRMQIIPLPPGSPPPALLGNRLMGLPSFDLEGLGDFGSRLIDAGMDTELQALIPVMADASKTKQTRFPSSRTETLASLGEEAFDAGDNASAKLCAEAAFQQLKLDWQDPNQNSNGYYSVTVSPGGIHFTCDLLLRLGLLDQFDDLEKLLSQPPASNMNLNQEAVLADAHRLRLMLGDHPHGLTPALWLDAATDGSLNRNVAWDLTARLGSAGLENSNPYPDASLDAPARIRAANGPNGEFFSVEARALPQLDGKFELQILAGPSPEDLRVLKTVTAATARGTTDVALQANDRFIRAICQTSETPPRVFVGPILPISQGANLMSGPFHERCYSFTIYSNPPDDHPIPLTTDNSIPIESKPGGPQSGATFEQITCPNLDARLELLGPRQQLAPQTTYRQSGWVRGSGSWGFRYLNEKGNTISESMVAYPGGKDEWRFVQQTFTTPDDSAPASGQLPAHAVAVEPFLRLSQRDTFNWQGLYLGIAEQPIATQKPDIGPAPLMEGLAGATFIVESPQHGILAVVFGNGDLRCFDLGTHLELGSPAKLPGNPVGVAFINGGKDLVAADVDGNLIVRPVQDKISGRIVYHAPWSIDFLSASPDGAIAAVASRSDGKIAVVDLGTGRALSLIQVTAGPLTTIVISSDGKNLYTRRADLSGQIWDTLAGQPIPVSAPVRNFPPPMPYFNQSRMFRGNGGSPIDNIALAHFFHLPHTLLTNEWQRPCWLQVQAGFYVISLDSYLVYGMAPDRQVFQHIKTGPVTAFCLSSLGNDVYTVSDEGALKVWKLPGDTKIPPLAAPTEIKVAVPGPSSPPPLHLAIEAPDHLRGFPKTTLSPELQVTVRDNNLNLVAGAQIEIQSDLPGTRFKSGDAHGVDNFHSKLDVPTDANGKASFLVSLGQKPGIGKILITVRDNDVLQKREVALEAIDETKPLQPPHDVFMRTQESVNVVTWNEDADNRTGFIVRRQVDSGPWRTLALLPEDANSYTDNDIVYNHNYRYDVTSTNESKYGYPARLPSPPDRLGSFLP